MKATAFVENLNEIFSVKTFLIALAALCVLLVGTIGLTALFFHTPSKPVETVVAIVAEETVSVHTSDLNQMDLWQQPKDIVEAIEGLHEKTAYGFAPITRNEDNLTPLKAYAADFKRRDTTQGVISLVMLDFGLSNKTSEAAINDLPAGVSLALSPYSRSAQQLTNNARRKNREVWLELPVQSKEFPYHDTGPNTLLTQLNTEANKDRFIKTISAATGYTGIVVHDVTAFANNQAFINNTLSDISTRGLGLVSATPDDKTITSIASSNGMAFGKNSITLDQFTSPRDLQEELEALQTLALEKKEIIVFFKPYPVTIKAIQDWSKTLTNQGVQLAPLSYTLNAQ